MKSTGDILRPTYLGLIATEEETMHVYSLQLTYLECCHTQLDTPGEMNCQISFAADTHSYMPTLLPAPETGMMAKTGNISVMKTDFVSNVKALAEIDFIRDQ